MNTLFAPRPFETMVRSLSKLKIGPCGQCVDNHHATYSDDKEPSRGQKYNGLVEKSAWSWLTNGLVVR